MTSLDKYVFDFGLLTSLGANPSSATDARPSYVQILAPPLGIEITEARGDEDVFPSSSLLREYVSLEGCELATRGLLKMPQRPHPILR